MAEISVSELSADLRKAIANLEKPRRVLKKLAL